DAPSFSKGANQSAVRNSGPKTIAGWATSLSAGPANESLQLLDFLVSSDNPGLFSAAPAVSPAGTLTFTPGSAPGSALVTVRIHDNGGTANFGNDTSAAQTFTMTVTPGTDTAPTAGDDTANTNEDSGVNIPVLAND